MEGFWNTDKASTFFTFGSVWSREMTAYTVSPPVKWTYNLFIPHPEFFVYLSKDQKSSIDEAVGIEFIPSPEYRTRSAI
jgi:hypothetical protein